MTTQTSPLPFDLSAAMNHLTARDEKLAELITNTLPFQMDADPLQSPYEALLESIAYQSISGKAAATIFGRIKSLSGIGPWTVEMFLIFRLGRPDVLPIHDLGVRKGWSITYGKKHMPKPKELLAFGERWRPYRTIASWYMWRACQRAGNAAMRKIRPAKVRNPPKRISSRSKALRRSP